MRHLARRLTPALRRAAAAGLLIGAGSAGAVGLGTARGAVTIGRSLDITLPLLREEAGSEAPQCVGASVFYGDTRLSAHSVNAEIEGAPETRWLRVKARPAVDEPVVTVEVQLGCTGRLVRRVVLLADPDLARDDVPLLRPSVLVVSPARPAPTSVAPIRAAPPLDARAQPEPVAGAQHARASRHASSVVHRQAHAAQAAPARARPRLQLAPLDLREIAEPGLRVTDTLRPFTEASPERRALALATWKALNAQPEDILRHEQRLAELERAQQLAASLQQEQLAGFERRLKASESQRVPAVLLLAVGLVAIGALVLAGLLWRRSTRLQQEARWWEPAEDDGEPAHQAMPGDREHLGDPAGRSLQDGFGDDPGTTAMPPRPATRPVRRPGEIDRPPAPLALTTEESDEVKHAVDFFAALGHYDRAVDALHHHVTQHAQSSALGWLELLNLLVVLGRRDEFVRARSEFMRLFNADLPAFEQWGNAGAGLEDYPSVMARIVALWPAREAVKVLEQALFNEPGVAHQVTFSMASFNELVVLHQVCSELVANSEAGAAPERVPFVFDAGWCPSVWASMSPAAVAAAAATTASSADLARKVPPAPRAKVDLDLSQFSSLEEIVEAGLDVDLAALGTVDAWGGPDPL